MASKWAWLKDKYPSLSDEAEYDEVLLAAMGPHRGKPLSQLAAEANRIEVEKEDAARILSGINAELTAVERLMETAFEEENTEKVVVDGFSYAPKIDPSPRVADPVAFRAWIDANQPEILSVNAMTLKGMVSRALEAGEVMPDGIEIKVRTSISRRKA